MRGRFVWGAGLLPDGRRVAAFVWVWVAFPDRVGVTRRLAPGAARQPITFFARAKKVTKETTPRFAAPFGVPCVARLVRRLRNSRYALKQSSPTPPDQPALLGGAQGKKKQKVLCARRAPACFCHQHSLRYADRMALSIPVNPTHLSTSILPLAHIRRRQ